MSDLPWKASASARRRLCVGLRCKTIIILASTIVSAALAVVIVARAFYGGNLDRLEGLDARDALARAWALVEDDMGQLDVLVRDWATWDDTWEFAGTRDRSYVDANLAFDDLLEGLRISALVILDASGDIAYGRAGDERWIPDLAECYRNAKPSSASGWTRIVPAAGSLHLGAARPILRSDGSGERRGTLVMTRLIDGPLLSRYSWLSGGSVEIRAREGGSRPAEPPGTQAIEVSSERGLIEAAMPIPLPPGEGQAEIRVSMDRSVDRVDGLPLAFYIAVAVSTISLIGMVSIILFEAAVLGRMRRMGKELERVAAGENPELRLTETGNDELSALERTMNVTLDALYSMIGERDAAIREIHHRVKNNLQIISSLVSLQAGKAGSWESAALFDIRRRVMTIAFVHEELYLDREIERVDAERLFSRLTAMVADFHETGGRVRVDPDCGRFSIRLEQAIPIGLATCEILANSFRHAFPDGRVGTIRLAAKAEADGSLRLSIDDDGIGISEGAAKGLGLSLVETLARQTQASYSLGPGSGGGTSFVMTVPNAALA